MALPILGSRLSVPRDSVEPEDFDGFTYRIYDSFGQFTYDVRTWAEGAFSYDFHRGDVEKIKFLLDRRFGGQFEDQRSIVPIRYPLKFTGELMSDQTKALNEWIASGYGILRAPPRWGKTVWLVALICKLKQRTLMLAHTEDLCGQLEETIRAFTNIDDLEAAAGEQLVGTIPKGRRVFYPLITASTYQRFGVSGEGREFLRQHAQDFGFVIVDECHRCATTIYTQVVGQLDAFYRVGVTATPERKDELHCIVRDVLGPVTVVAEREALSVEYSWERTEVTVKEFANWGTMWNRLVKAKRRTKMIAKKIVEDVRDGHFVLVVTERLKHLEAIEDALLTIDDTITIGKLSGATRKREQFRNDVKIGRYRVVLAMAKIVELGYNVPRWSCLHNVLPMTNSQNWYQRVSRIRTPMEPAFEGDTYEKPQPVARVWVDSGHKAVYAYRNTVKKENDRLGFKCLNPPPPRKKKGKRTGMVTFKNRELFKK